MSHLSRGSSENHRRKMDGFQGICLDPKRVYPGIPTTIEIMGVNITTIDYLRVLIIKIGSTIILMVVEAQGILKQNTSDSIPSHQASSAVGSNVGFVASFRGISKGLQCCQVAERGVS